MSGHQYDIPDGGVGKRCAQLVRESQHKQHQTYRKGGGREQHGVFGALRGEELCQSTRDKEWGGWRSGNRDETAEQVEEASKKGALADQLELHCPTWCPLIGTEHTTCGWSARRGAVSVPIHWILKT